MLFRSFYISSVINRLVCDRLLKFWRIQTNDDLLKMLLLIIMWLTVAFYFSLVVWMTNPCLRFDLTTLNGFCVPMVLFQSNHSFMLLACHCGHVMNPLSLTAWLPLYSVGGKRGSLELDSVIGCIEGSPKWRALSSTTQSGRAKVKLTCQQHLTLIISNGIGRGAPVVTTSGSQAWVRRFEAPMGPQ